jgi:hypothetical protein
MADDFSEQVHGVVRQLNAWLQAERPNVDQLMPALAVVLGRVIASRAGSDVELTAMVSMAMQALGAAASEHWQGKTPTATH